MINSRKMNGESPLAKWLESTAKESSPTPASPSAGILMSMSTETRYFVQCVKISQLEQINIYTFYVESTS